MSIYTDKVLLIIGGGDLITSSFVNSILSEGASEVRILGENETAVQSLRDKVSLKPETRQRVRFFVGDVSDNAYMAEAMSGVDYVLNVPSLPRAFDCEVAPAESTITFLKTVTGVIHTAIDGCVKKLLVVSPNTSFISKMHAMLAALMQTVVVAEARYQGSDSGTTICFTRQGVDVKLETRNLKLIGYAFENAVNGDVIIWQDDSFKRIPCENFEMRR